MPSVAPTPTTWPPPVPVILSNSEDEISAVRVTAQRDGTVLGLAAFVQGSGAGNATPQAVKFAVYSHNSGTNRPQTKLAETAAFNVGRDDPILGIQARALLAPLAVVAGTTYWIAVQLSSIAGNGKAQFRGLTGGGNSILGAPAAFGSGVPAAFPAGGTVSTNRPALGVIFVPTPFSAAGAIVGEFIVGDGTLVGQPPISQQNDPALILNAKAYTTNIFTDLKTVTPGKPKLLLNAKAYSVISSSTVTPGKATLLLNGKAYAAIAPSIVHLGKPTLLLNGKPYALGVSSILEFGKPTLILKAKPFTAGEVAFVPTVPINIILTPTMPVDYDLVPTTAQSYDLVPTVEEFR